MAWQPIRRILPGAIMNREVAKKVEATRLLQMAQDCLVKLWGEEKAGYVQFQSFAEGQLTAYASAPAAAQELRVSEMRLRNEVNRMVGTKAVISLNIRHGSLTMVP